MSCWSTHGKNERGIGPNVRYYVWQEVKNDSVVKYFVIVRSHNTFKKAHRYELPKKSEKEKHQDTHIHTLEVIY